MPELTDQETEAVSWNELLARCAEEPIHQPGAIQPHGALVAFDRTSHRVLVASANAADWLAADVLVGAALDDLLGEAGPRVLAELYTLAQTSSLGVGVADAVLPSGRAAELVLHERDGVGVLELLPGGLPAPGHDEVQAGADALLQAATRDELFQALAERIRGFTGYARAALYLFDPCWNGQVLAEASDGRLPSLLDHHFPASDVPAQARELYTHNPVRQMPDATYAPVPLVPATLPGTHQRLDLSFSALRSLSPFHVEYVKNMNVAASMSVSLLSDGVLAGLVTCHHPEPRAVSYRTLQACVYLARLAAAVLGRLDAAAEQRRTAQIHALIEVMLGVDDIAHVFERHGERFLALVDAAGAAFFDGERLHRIGQTPSEPQTRALADWMLAREEEVFATESMVSVEGLPAPDPEIACLLGVVLAHRIRHVLLWFRPEYVRTIKWAGLPSKRVFENALGQRHLHPRLSFDTWTSEHRGKGMPWSAGHVGAARLFRNFVHDLAYERLATERRLTEELRLSNAALQSRSQEMQRFSYIASHDLQEPLRKISMFSELLASEYAAALPDPAQQYLSRIQTASVRMSALIRDLLAFSRVSRGGDAFEVMPLAPLVGEALYDLDLRLHESGGHVDVEADVEVYGNATQLRLLLTNLVGNALKFRRDGVPPRVVVRAVRAGNEVHLSVEDNGIGLDVAYTDRIFEPFVRLHAASAYDGTGIGLALCRRIVEAHGGTIAATGTPGQGSRFDVVLLTRPDVAGVAVR